MLLSYNMIQLGFNSSRISIKNIVIWHILRNVWSHSHNIAIPNDDSIANRTIKTNKIHIANLKSTANTNLPCKIVIITNNYIMSQGRAWINCIEITNNRMTINYRSRK